MGADIYLESVNGPCRAKWQPMFDAAVKAREAAKTDGERERAQAKVEAAYEGIFSQGYFRDSYNDSSLLWLVGLSWWRDVGDGMLQNGYLPVEHAAALADRLEHEEITEQRVAAHIKARKVTCFDSLDQAVDYWRDQRTRFVALLRQSDDLGEPLYCSV